MQPTVAEHPKKILGTIAGMAKMRRSCNDVNIFWEEPNQRERPYTTDDNHVRRKRTAQKIAPRTEAFPRRSRMMITTEQTLPFPINAEHSRDIASYGPTLAVTLGVPSVPRPSLETSVAAPPAPASNLSAKAASTAASNSVNTNPIRPSFRSEN